MNERERREICEIWGCWIAKSKQQTAFATTSENKLLKIKETKEREEEEEEEGKRVVKEREYIPVASRTSRRCRAWYLVGNIDYKLEYSVCAFPSTRGQTRSDWNSVALYFWSTLICTLKDWLLFPQIYPLSPPLFSSLCLAFTHFSLGTRVKTTLRLRLLMLDAEANLSTRLNQCQPTIERGEGLFGVEQERQFNISLIPCYSVLEYTLNLQ